MTTRPAGARAVRTQRTIGVVCDDRADVRRRVCFQLERAGISVAGEAESFVPLLRLVLSLSPAVAVVTLPLTGTSGMTGVSALRAAAPGCEVVVLSLLGNLEAAASEAGALAVLAEDDARALSALLTEVAGRADRSEGGRAAHQAGPPPEESSADSPPACSAGRSTTNASS